MRYKLQIITCMAIVVGFAYPLYAEEHADTPYIKDFINYVWEKNPVLAEVDARVLSAKAGEKAASKWQYNPEIEFEFEDVDGEDKTKIFGISQTIDWSGKSLSSGKAAGFELEAVKADKEQVKQDVALNVLSSLVDYKISKDIYDLAIERSNLMERFAKLAQKGFKAGDIDQSEKNLAQLALSEAYITQAEAQTLLFKAKSDLENSIGFKLVGDFNLPELPHKLPELPKDLDEDKMISYLPRLRAIKYREDAANALIKKAMKDRIPDPTIGVTKGKSSGANAIGFTISLPLNVLNNYGAELDMAKSDAIARAKLGQSAFHSARSQLKSAFRSYELSKKAWEAWNINGAQALAKQTDILDRKFKVGDLSATDYLVQIKQALDTQVAAKELYANAWQSWFAWLGASGTVNQWIQNLGE